MPDSERFLLRPWPLFLLGVLLMVLGPASYALQLGMRDLRAPWHVPILATLGVLLMIASLWRQWSIIRGAGLALFVLIAGFQWFMLLVGFRSPDYAGPIATGQKLPAFATSRADGQTFTSEDLVQGTSTLLVFFRGRW